MDDGPPADPSRPSPRLDPRDLARLFDVPEADPPGPAHSNGDGGSTATNLLVVGVPRSGTTWIARALAQPRGAGYLHEPDNPNVCFFAYAAKRGRGAYPYLRPGDEAPRYAECWDAALGIADDAPPPPLDATLKAIPTSERRVALTSETVTSRMEDALARVRPATFAVRPTHRVVKSVHSALSVRWIADRWRPKVLVIRRHPLDILASWCDLGMDAFLHDDDRFISAPALDELVGRLGCPAPPASPASQVARAAWLIGVLAVALDDAAGSLPDAVAVSHETVCRDPVGELRWLARTLGLVWSPEAQHFVVASDGPGRGESLVRVAAALPGAWRHRLPPRVADEARSVLERFPLAPSTAGL